MNGVWVSHERFKIKKYKYMQINYKILLICAFLKQEREIEEIHVKFLCKQFNIYSQKWVQEQQLEFCDCI